VVWELIYISLVCIYVILSLSYVTDVHLFLKDYYTMSVPSATAAASTRPRKDSRTTSPKVRSMTPKQSGVDGLDEFQRWVYFGFFCFFLLLLLLLLLYIFTFAQYSGDIAKLHNNNWKEKHYLQYFIYLINLFETVPLIFVMNVNYNYLN
jgi:hypothetical protein